MVEVAEKLVEAMHRRQVRVAVAEVVLAKLAGDVALLLQQIGNRRRPVRNALRRTGHADGQQPGAEGLLTENERCTACGAALLRVRVGDQRAFLRDAIDVRRLVAHHPEAVGADVVPANVIAPDDEDVGLLRIAGAGTMVQKRRSRARGQP